jgi:hypothetical protein
MDNGQGERLKPETWDLNWKLRPFTLKVTVNDGVLGEKLR